MPKYLYNCCDKNFSGILPYRDHLKTKHGTTEKIVGKYECKCCRKSYDNPLLFIEHCLTKGHEEKVKEEEIERKYEFIQRLRCLNSTSGSSVTLASVNYLKCPECNVNIKLWHVADDHFRSKRHIKTVIEKEMHKILNTGKKFVLPQRLPTCQKPINPEKLSQAQKKVNMEVQKFNEASTKSLKSAVSDKNTIQRNCSEKTMKSSTNSVQKGCKSIPQQRQICKSECSSQPSCKPSVSYLAKAESANKLKTEENIPSASKRCQRTDKPKIIMKEVKTITTVITTEKSLLKNKKLSEKVKSSTKKI
ncbi:uncharacterized protein LOC111617806 [Centruroides sculpturatus]|uniref:uncharacterized protein LOC111617806 n=1 Tax=Centruroides sculpturatus TaxID=218467 RepID=UPI000C6D9878|nr:uncharacterized protein LOC111617806 [Centruroides sculpturatus]